MILQVSNLIYVDQPIGTGFSYSTDKRDIQHDEIGVSNDLYDFLQVCLFLSMFIKFLILSVSGIEIVCDVLLYIIVS